MDGFKNDTNAINDPKSFEEKFRMWYKPLCKMAFRYVANKQAAEDIVQDVFVKLWQQRNKLIFQNSLKSYLYRAVINTSINYLEKNKKNLRVSNEGWTSFDTAINDTEQQVNYTILQQEVNKALNHLPTECKKVFMLSRYEGLTNKEIAETLEFSHKTVENQMTKALNILRKNLHHLIKNIVLFLFLLSA